MPHLRERYGRILLTKALSHSPIVGLIGQRQVGKTTLANQLSAEYVTCDRPEILRMASSDPEAFIQARAFPFTIDECQLCPPLFPVLKEQVRLHPRKGQFILTGSIRFTSRKAIKESLTGRISNVEILPLTLSESHRRPLSVFLSRLVATSSPRQTEQLLGEGNPTPWCTEKLLNDYLLSGGLPGICFSRSAEVRHSKWRDQLDTLLDRDLRLILETSITLPVLRTLVESLAEVQGEPLELARLSRKTRISRVTLPKLLHALEGIFLIRRYPSRGGLNSPILYFEDQGMAGYLKKQDAIRSLTLDGLLRLIHSCILPQFRYRPELLPSFWSYRTRGGASVPFVIQTSGGTLGLLPEGSDRSSSSSLGSARSFLRTHPKAKAVILTTGKSAKIISPALLEIPITWAM
ncbi:MAG: AAA family ATPase [Oligoflexia bacterium]|nr:AAA family ATPase [Oligoflexia bacterium]